jgi:excisionase family DNA binding protein
MFSIVDVLAEQPAVLTSKELATALGCTVRSATRLCSDGSLRAYKIGGRWVVARHELLAQLLASRTPALEASHSTLRGSHRRQIGSRPVVVLRETRRSLLVALESAV